MSKTIQIRNVSDAIYRKLKARAKRMGMSISGYVLTEIEEIAERPTLTEFRERLKRRDPVGPIETVVFLHKEREVR